MEAAGRAARPKDLFNLRGAGGQAVGRGGGELGRFFSWNWTFLWLPFGDFLRSAAGTGGRGQDPHVDRYSSWLYIYFL